MQQIHPIWLQLKEKETQERFDSWLRKKIYFGIMVITILASISFVIKGIQDREKPFNQKALYTIQTGSQTLTLLILWLGMKVNLAFTDYITFTLIGVRIISTFALLHLIKSGTPGFELIDRKEINDSIPFVSITALLVSTCGWRLNLLISAPMAIVSSVIAVNDSLSTSDDNMACYETPEPIAGRMSGRWVILMVAITYAGYMFRKTSLQRFIEQEMSHMKQE